MYRMRVDYSTDCLCFALCIGLWTLMDSAGWAYNSFQGAKYALCVVLDYMCMLVILYLEAILYSCSTGIHL